MTQLGLGTAQFGMDYGVSNVIGQTSHDELAAIIALAQHSAIEVLDTAALYGTSEAALGDALPTTHTFSIVTKTPYFDPQLDARDNAAMLAQTFERSLLRLRQKSLYGLLVHDVNFLLRPDGDAIWQALRSLQNQGLVEKIGVSVYTGEQIDAVLARFDPGLVQLPINLLDQRLLRDGHLNKLKARGIEIHARSIFLQGLLLMNPREVPDRLQDFAIELSGYKEFLDRYRLEPLQAALGFIRELKEIDVALVGVNCRTQLKECLSVFASTPQSPVDFSQAACHNEALLNPALWPASRPTGHQAHG